jgi:hypothetical protein
MQFYCQNTILPKKDSKLCLRVEKWSRSVKHLFFYFYTKPAESSNLCRFCIESVNVFVLPRFDLCFQTFRTCANAFPNEFTVRSYEYCVGKHWILYWIQENKTATYFLRSRLFTYDIMKNFKCN